MRFAFHMELLASDQLPSPRLLYRSLGVDLDVRIQASRAEPLAVLL